MKRINKTNLLRIGMLGIALGGIVLVGCDVDKTQEGEMPDVDVNADAGKLPEIEVTEEGEMPTVDVDVEGGKLPAYDVDTADIDVGTRKVEVTVPDVDVDMPDDKPEGGIDETKTDLEH